MNLETVTIPRAEARQSYLDYRREAKRTNDDLARRELEQIARAFRIASKEEIALIALSPTLSRGGLVTRTHVARHFHDGEQVERRTHYAVPAIAVAPVEARFCWTLGVQGDGSVQFSDSVGRDRRYRRGVVRVQAGSFELPPGFQPGRDVHEIGRWQGAWSTMVPVVPPKHRPGRGYGQCHVLFEAEEWTWSTLPAPPGDPALLRHVGGDIYAVLAQWDLSPLEQLVLSGRSLDEARGPGW